MAELQGITRNLPVFLPQTTLRAGWFGPQGAVDKGYLASKGVGLKRVKPEAERRKWPRLPIAIPVFVRSRDEKGKELLEFATALNISAGRSIGCGSPLFTALRAGFAGDPQCASGGGQLLAQGSPESARPNYARNPCRRLPPGRPQILPSSGCHRPSRQSSRPRKVASAL